MSPDRLDLAERDLRDHARILTEHNDAIKGLKTEASDLARDKAVRAVEDKHLDDRLDRIEHSIAGIHRLGWWILAAFGASAIALVANFMFRGGFFVQ